jgi:hypothetical protein
MEIKIIHIMIKIILMEKNIMDNFMIKVIKLFKRKKSFNSELLSISVDPEKKLKFNKIDRNKLL